MTVRSQYVSLHSHCSVLAPVHIGIPLDSCVGPILIAMFIKSLSTIIDSHSITRHSFVDDLQLQMSAPSYNISKLLQSMQPCITLLLLGHATLSCVAWRLFVDSRQVHQLPHLYLLSFCQELTTVSRCSLVVFIM